MLLNKYQLNTFGGKRDRDKQLTSVCKWMAKEGSGDIAKRQSLLKKTLLSLVG